MSNESCLVRRLSAFVSLTDKESRFIASLEDDAVEHRAGDVLIDAAETPGIMVLNSGWALSRVTKKGESAVVRIFLPGEVIGLAELGVKRHVGQQVVMQTEGVVCPFNRIAIRELYSEMPRLAALLMAISGLDQVTLRDRLASSFVSEAEERLMWYLLDLRARLAVAGVGSGNRFRVPFTQAEIGQAIGVTSIYISRMFSTLVRDGWLEIDRPYYRLLRREEMEERISFVDHYAALDQSWFPEPV